MQVAGNNIINILSYEKDICHYSIFVLVLWNTGG